MALSALSVVGIVNAHFLPRFERLADTSQTLTAVSKDHCMATCAAF
jgi:hypothetical protein